MKVRSDLALMPVNDGNRLAGAEANTIIFLLVWSAIKNLQMFRRKGSARIHVPDS